MENRKQKMISQIIFIMMFIVLFGAGVLAGLHHQWFYVVFFFYIAVYTVDNHVGYILNLKIDACFGRLQNLITKNSDSAHLENRLVSRSLAIFMVISCVVMLSLSIIAGVRQRWLLLCIILVAMAITNYISTGIMFALKIKVYSKRIEELVCQITDNMDSQR